MSSTIIFSNLDNLVQGRTVGTALFGGHSSLTGTITEENVETIALIHLYEQMNGTKIDSTYSDASGNWGFYNLRNDIQYFVVGVDIDSVYKNAAVSDRISIT